MNVDNHQFTFQRLLFQKVHHHFRVHRRKSRCRLIDKHHKRLTDKLQSNVQTLALTTTDGLVQRVAHNKVGGGFQVKVLKNLVHGLVNLLLGVLAEAEFGTIVKVLIYSKFFNQQIVLRHKSDDAVQLLLLGVDVVAVDENLAALWLKISVEHVEQCRFTNTRAAHNADELAALLAEVEVVQAVLAALEAEFNVFSREHHLLGVHRIDELRYNVAVVD